MRIFAPAALLLVILGACGGPSDNAASIDYGPNGTFTGTIGAGWTDEELRTNAFGVFCRGGTPTDLVIQPQSDGSRKVSGRCV